MNIKQGMISSVVEPSVRATIIRHLLRIGQLLRFISARQSCRMAGIAHLLQPDLETLQLALLDHQCLIIQIFDDVVMLVLVDLEDDRFDGGITFNEDAWARYQSCA